MKIWHRYLFRQLFATFFFLLLAIFAIYLIFNLSEQGSSLFSSPSVSLKKMALYYLANFLVFLDFFFPLSFMLATLKVLLDLNSHQELTVFQMTGLSRKKILIPFFFFATLLSLFSYLNAEWLAPSAHETIDAFWSTHSKKKARKEHLYTLPLEDDSELVYQSYDPLKQKLNDVIWIASKKEIWRIEELQIQTKRARVADHLIKEGALWKKQETFPIRIMDEIPFGSLHAMQRFIPFENRSLLSLLRQMRTRLPDRTMAEAHFYYKTIRPLLPFFVLLSIAPLSMRFGRGRSHFLLVLAALALFFSFMTILDGMLLIGETRLLPASLAILSPFLILFATTFRSFIRL